MCVCVCVCVYVCGVHTVKKKRQRRDIINNGLDHFATHGDEGQATSAEHKRWLGSDRISKEAEAECVIKFPELNLRPLSTQKMF